MKAIDTNVVIRIVTSDDPVQTPVARALVADGVFVSHSVFLESEWVLRSFYRWKRTEIAEALDDLINLECVHVLHEKGLFWALDRYRRGADWADMLHLLAARGTESFQTFDGSVARDAGASGPIPIEILR
ncbi:MAG: type II toxin-antitoxin system VapC family toxin [Allosphingosinicella sp.]